MNIVTRRTILYYINEYQLAANSLKTWYDEFLKTEYRSFNELKKVYGNASIIANNRVVFNIKGNFFRLIISINFTKQAVYLIWFGTHAEYDKIDATSISFKL
jgi:mRNA interferase HigB